MKTLITSLMLLSITSWAETQYMNNDGRGAPETLDRAKDIQSEVSGEMQREEAEEETEEMLTPEADAQQIQREEEERIEDNYLIGPYNGKGEYTFPTEDEKKQKEELRDMSDD